MAIPHPREIQVAVVNWLDERYPFTKTVDEALYQRVPNFANAFYYCFGGMVFILIVFQLLTGVLLALYYIPDATGNPAPAIPFWPLVFKNLRLFFLGSDDFPPAAKAAAARALNEALEGGWPGFEIEARFPLESIAEAHGAVEGRKVSGRVVLSIGGEEPAAQQGVSAARA